MTTIRTGYIVTAGVANSDDSNSTDTISDGSTTDEITKVDTIGDESNASKVPVISLKHFIAFLLKLLPGFLDSREFQVTPVVNYLLCGMSAGVCEIFTHLLAQLCVRYTYSLQL